MDEEQHHRGNESQAETWSELTVRGVPEDNASLRPHYIVQWY